MRMKTLSLVMMMVLSLFTACKKDNSEPEAADPNALEAGVMKGRVTDAQGRPMAGIEVFANHSSFNNVNGIGTTNNEGRYRARVTTAGAYFGWAQHRFTYNNVQYIMDLHPDNPSAFNNTEGAIRNFTWKLTGEKPNSPGSFYGATVVLDLEHFEDPSGEPVDFSQIEVTLVPQGTLVDGTTGSTIVRKLSPTSQGFAVRDIPLGRYTLTARYAPPGRGPWPLKVQQRGFDPVTVYHTSKVFDFEQLGTSAQEARFNAQFQ